MGRKASLRTHRTGRGASLIAIDSHKRHAERDMGNKRGKGRSRKDQKGRSTVKHDLRTGAWA